MAVDTLQPSSHSPAGGQSEGVFGRADAYVGVRIWLYTVALLILATAVVGAATRLTDSGLSITEWEPIMGAFPPMNAADWEVALEKYRQTTEYQNVNRGMSMAEFKVIYWWEWAHRQFGRLVGFSLLIPLVVLWGMGKLKGSLPWKVFGLGVLVAGQGVLGWYMVQSGLAGRVDVSQYRLAAHLGLATVIFGLTLWVAWSLRPADNGTAAPVARWVSFAAFGMVALVYAQIILGAFVAGMRAGLTYNTWPLMDGDFIPDGLFRMNPWWVNLFENLMTVQFNHRKMAYVLVALAVIYAVVLVRSTANRAVRKSAGLFGLALTAQFVVGIVTLLWQVPISLGLLHQGLALIVLATAIYHFYQVRRAPKFEFV